MLRIRPLGQPPKIWQVIEKLGKDEKPIKFTIQEIPEDRYEEAIQHMCMYFLADESICHYLNAKNDSLFVQDMSTMWRLSLAQGISIAAFIDNPNGGKPIIVAVNLLGVDIKNQKDSSSHYQFKSEKCKKVLEVISNAKKKVMYEHYNVDKYLYANGLSVDPEYRGYKLGKDIMQIRNLIGSTYRIPVTISVVTSTFSQKSAADAGFEELLAKKFSHLVDKDGKKYFSGVDCMIKIMGKRLL